MVPVDTMAALAIFTCRPNSHPFKERHVLLHEPVKVGRSVARARPAANNAIFDCKVLSRNHALIWYENGTFYLQDTKSSNGTFINNLRLSKGCEESTPREIYSGDIIQFGVDVMENSRRVTHGCIIASITLFHPDGREAKPSFQNGTFSGTGPSIGAYSQELYQLAQYLQEALHREQMLESKLAMLQRLVQNTQEASETGWQALIDEDRLLSRLEVLESQLQVYAKNQTEDNLRQELVALQDDKHTYETTAKESLRKVLQEKLEAVRKLSDLEQSLSNTEDECTHLKEMCELSQTELKQLAEKHEESVQEVEELQQKLNEAENNHKDELQRVEREKDELQEKLNEMVKQEGILIAKVESLQADNDFTREQLTALKDRLESVKDTDNRIISETESQGVQVDMLIENLECELSNDDLETKALKYKLKQLQEDIESYRAQIVSSENRLRDSREKVDHFQNELERAQQEASVHISKIASLEEKLKLSDLHMNHMMENAVADLRMQLSESKKQTDKTNDLSKKLGDHIAEIEEQVQQYHKEESQRQLSDDSNSNTLTATEIENHLHSDTIPKSLHYQEIEKLKDLLCESRDAYKENECELSLCKKMQPDDEVDLVNTQIKAASSEIASFQSQLADLEELVNEKTLLVEELQATDCEKTSKLDELQEQLSKADSSVKEVKQQMLVLRGQLAAEKESRNTEMRERESLQHQLLEAQQLAKHSKNEAEQCRMKMKEIQDELETERQSNGDVTPTEEPPLNKGQISVFKEFAALKEECMNLRERILNIEADMRTKKENTVLTADYGRLQESYNDLEQLKERLEDKELTWKLNLTDAQKEADHTKDELENSHKEIVNLKEKVADCTSQISELKNEMEYMSDEYSVLADRSKTLSACAMIPIIMLILAIMLALYPTLATLTATTVPE
ncbi:uncharacterized protein LOC141901252 isoform X2 [Tubulanus polymorphus]|uniref:uncharacterized protein LOC141901252 isoform X2 n=1 Tax=Tubulanus polymorphus TaxID=672921 RepID=UPI003DA5163C